MPKVEFIFDFGSPNAYLSHRVIPAIEARTGTRFDYVPCLLGGIFKATNNRSPMEAFGPVKNKLEYQQLEMRRFVARHGLEKYRRNPHFPVNTLMMMRAAVAAKETDRFEDYVEACFVAMWEAEKKMDDPEVFTATLDAAGLDGAALLAATQDPQVKARLIENTEAAVERGVFGIPSFFVGDDLYFGKDRLGEVEEEIGRQA